MNVSTGYMQMCSATPAQEPAIMWREIGTSARRSSHSNRSSRSTEGSTTPLEFKVIAEEAAIGAFSLEVVLVI